MPIPYDCKLQPLSKNRALDSVYVQRPCMQYDGRWEENQVCVRI